MKIKIVKKKDSKKRREEWHRGFMKQLIEGEVLFKKKLIPLFDIQEAEVLEKTRFMMKSTPAFALKEKAISDFLFNEEQQIGVFIKWERPVILQELMKAGKRVNDELDLGAFEPLKARIDDFLDDRTFQFGRDVNKTTTSKLAKTIQEGLSNQESVDQVSSRIKKVFKEATTTRADTIARTEVGSSVNFGQVEAYKQSRIINAKEWVHITPGPSARESHIAMDGVSVGLDEKFIVAGEPMNFPLDPNASPSNTVNCNCTTIGITK